MMSGFRKRSIVLFLLILTSCTTPPSKEYYEFYDHLQTLNSIPKDMEEEDYFLVILVEACHLDYTDTWKFFESIAVHPFTGSRRGDLGHAWIYLQGKLKSGETFILEGGHSGEYEDFPAKYFDGIMNYHDWGYANPTCEQKNRRRYEPNPIKYLWTIRKDGFFQKGSGGHDPTFAAKIPLTSQQFEKILSFIRPSRYPYMNYGLMGPQCCTFAAQVASLVGLSLQTKMTMKIDPAVYYRRSLIRLWEDPRYSVLTFSTPDILEKSLIEAVRNGEAQYALDWYLK